MRIIDLPSPNFGERQRPIELVMLHYTGMMNAKIALERLRDRAPRAGAYAAPGEHAEDPNAVLGRVSAHYVVGEEGEIFALVGEDKTAWHAGAGEWAGEGDLNARSVGVEIVNGGHDHGLPDYPDAQIVSVIALVRAVCERHGLRAHQIIGHSDAAPTRKCDPGERFPWRRLAEAGLALWPRASLGSIRSSVHELSSGDAGPKVRLLQASLHEIGYGLVESGAFDEGTTHVVRAFQRRFRPALIDGVADSQTLAIVDDVLAQTRRMIRPIA